MTDLTEALRPIFHVILAGFTFAALASVLVFLLKRSAGKETADSYRLKSSLFSPAERSFLSVLEQINWGELTLAYKVRLADVFDVAKGYNRSRWQTAFNRISAKHIDFLLIRKSDGKPILGIELDDRSHRQAKRVRRDAFVDSVFESAGLSLLRVRAQASYNPHQIRDQIQRAVNPPAARSPLEG